MLKHPDCKTWEECSNVTFELLLSLFSDKKYKDLKYCSKCLYAGYLIRRNFAIESVLK